MMFRRERREREKGRKRKGCGIRRGEEREEGGRGEGK